ncbi:MAG: hypothetical protein ACREXX_05095 [Gammaproteobacteria bacterium]
MSVFTTLSDAGIELRHPDRLGEQRARCPRCDRGSRDDALAVLVEASSATWYCHRCKWTGAIGNGIDKQPGVGAKASAWASAAAKARELLAKANGDPSQHPYALKKRVPLPHVKRGPWPQRGWPDALLTPIYGPDDSLWTVQGINAEGDKDYLKGGRKQGGFHPVGDIRSAQRILVAEGLATVAAARKGVALPGIAAMDASNLEHAARGVRSINPNVELVFLADNDIRSDGRVTSIYEKVLSSQKILGGRFPTADSLTEWVKAQLRAA